MSTCIELIFSGFRIDFFPQTGMQFRRPLPIRSKFINDTDVTWQEDTVFLSVGHFPEHTDSCIRTTDTANEVTTSVSESLNGEFYEVAIAFEFRNPTQQIMNRCLQLDEAPHHVRITQFAMDGRPQRYRVVRAEEGAVRARIIDQGETMRVEVTVAAVNGLQSVDATGA